jgi:hypothetical protein
MFVRCDCEKPEPGRFFALARVLDTLRVRAATVLFDATLRRVAFFFADFFFADFFGVILAVRAFFLVVFLAFFLAAIMPKVYHRA